MSDTNPVAEPAEPPAPSPPPQPQADDDGAERADVDSAPALQRRDSGGGDLLS